jgi:tetratricopeptide (TPR) repeat protein
MILNYANFHSLFESHHYREAAAEARRLQALDAEDIGPIGCLAKALLAMGDYAEALPLFSRVDAFQRSDPRVPGQSGRGIWVSCIYWILGDRAKAIQIMRDMVDGILDGSIEFGDAAGGVQQGLLLYYMGVSANDEEAASRALDYLRTRTRRRAIELFPGPVARYHLGEIEFAAVIAAATKNRAHDVIQAIEVARVDLLSRRRLSVAVFHDGAKARAQGDHRHCHSRMQQCFSLENPLLEPEWYLARREVECSTVSTAQRASPTSEL